MKAKITSWSMKGSGCSMKCSACVQAGSCAYAKRKSEEQMELLFQDSFKNMVKKTREDIKML